MFNDGLLHYLFSYVGDSWNIHLIMLLVCYSLAYVIMVTRPGSSKKRRTL